MSAMCRWWLKPGGAQTPSLLSLGRLASRLDERDDGTTVQSTWCTSSMYDVALSSSANIRVLRRFNSSLVALHVRNISM